MTKALYNQGLYFHQIGGLPGGCERGSDRKMVGYDARCLFVRLHQMVEAAAVAYEAPKAEPRGIWARAARIEMVSDLKINCTSQLDGNIKVFW